MGHKTTESKKATMATNREQWFEYINQNDSYPKHSHQWTVVLKVGKPRKFFRSFGPFPSKKLAKDWVLSYKKKYTKPGFITGWELLPLCQILPVGEYID